MKKFVVCKLFLIVFGALLAVQSVNAGNWNKGPGDSSSNDFSRAEEAKTSGRKLPCKFNGAKVGASAYPRKEFDKSYGKRINRCHSKKGTRPIFYQKDGTSILVPEGTPIVAVADMRVISAIDGSAEYRCHIKRGVKGFDKSSVGSMTIKVPDPWNKGKIRKCQKPYHQLQLMFEVIATGEKVQYNHLKSTPLVRGFNEGKCRWPLMADRRGRRPFGGEGCGGFVSKAVSKGEVIGYSGSVGKWHGINIGITRNGKWLIAPEDNVLWESKATDQPYYLYPIMKSK